MNKSVKTYNILLPIWLLIFFPSWLWLILIPANYIIDRIVLGWSLGGMEEKGQFCRSHTWKICLAGFLSDFAGVIILLASALIMTNIGGGGDSFISNAADGLMFDPFSNVLSLLITIASIAVSGVVIYNLDRAILNKVGLDPSKAKKSALRLAIITAPYLYLIPSKLIY